MKQLLLRCLISMVIQMLVGMSLMRIFHVDMLTSILSGIIAYAVVFIGLTDIFPQQKVK